MAMFYLILLSSVIIYQDLKSHTISNRSNLYLAILLFMQPRFLPFRILMVTAFLSIAIFAILRIGMGDLKMWLVMLASQGKLLISLQYFELLYAVTLMVIAPICLAKRSIKGSIPFGPSLLLPFLLLHLGM